MIARNSGKGFFAAHWDWLVAGVGVVALVAAAVVLVTKLGVDSDEAVDEVLAEFSPRAGAQTGVEAVDISPYSAASRALAHPPKVVEPAVAGASFLASERRVFCEQGEAGAAKSCGLPIPFGLKVCPYCDAKQPEEKKIELDSDGDGLSDEYEKQHGLNPNDPADVDDDKDGDGFTNMEEFLAKTSPSDPASHPPYIDSLRLQMPLEETFLPFHFERVMPLPGGDYRFYFKDMSKKNAYGKRGLVYDMKTGEEIGKTGYVVKGYEAKTVKQKLAAAKGERASEKTVDVSEATVERLSDKKQLKLVVGDSKRKVAVDVQATLVYERGGTKTFTVVPGKEIDLNGTVYKVTEVKRVGAGARVTLENPELGKKTLEALEQ